MAKKPKEKQYRVWIELDPPVDAAHGAELARLANNMLQRLAGKERVDTFRWSEHENRYCYGSANGYIVCADHGHWFNLEALGRPLTEE